MYRQLLITAFGLGFAISSLAQSPLDGTSFQASTYNLRSDNVGVVRLIDVPETNCRVEDGPLGNDVPSEECLVLDSGTPPVEITFGAGPQVVGDATVEPTVTAFEGLAEPFDIVNFVTETVAPTSAFNTTGDLIEFEITTLNRDQFPSFEEDDYWGFSATGIQYPNAAPDSHVGLPFDEDLGNYTNFYFWYEGKEGPITEGYEVGLPVGLGVGRHPLDENREVLYPLYSTAQVDEQTDTVAGGTLDFYSHGSILDPSPDIGNILFLADGTVNFDLIDPLDDVVGFGLGVLVERPELTAPPEPTCDPNTMGDLDGDGMVAFSDFLILSNSFGQAVEGHAQGDVDCNGDVQFADFLILSNNFGTSVGAASAVPEPSAGLLFGFGLMLCLACRRK